MDEPALTPAVAATASETWLAVYIGESAQLLAQPGAERVLKPDQLAIVTNSLAVAAIEWGRRRGVLMAVDAAVASARAWATEHQAEVAEFDAQTWAALEELSDG
jgi:hypothetical protein